MWSKEGGEFGLIGMCYTNLEVAQQFIDLKKLDNKDIISQDKIYLVTTKDDLVY